MEIDNELCFSNEENVRFNFEKKIPDLAILQEEYEKHKIKEENS